MAKENRVCHTCGRSYYYCPSCPDDKRNPQIYIMWCNERCKNIFSLLTDETFKKISTSECKEELVKLGITLNDSFKDGVRAHAERVLSYEEPIVQSEIVINEIEVSEEPIGSEIENPAPKQVPINKKRKK